MPESGFKLVVAVVDYNDRNADGEPKTVEATQRITNYEMATKNPRDFITDMVEMCSRSVLDAVRAGDDGGEE